MTTPTNSINHSSTSKLSTQELRNAAPLHEADLEESADILLDLTGHLGRENAIFTQAQLIRKERRERKHMQKIDECAVPNEVIDYLVDSQIDDLIEVSRLSQVQEVCFRLFASGLTIGDIAETLGVSRQTITANLKRARSKVRKSYKCGKYAGWYEVYLSEIRRGAK